MKSITALTAEVKKDVEAYLSSDITELLFNERDLQMHLAIYLRGRMSDGHPKYDDVDVEYYVPKKVFGGKYIWDNELKIDIVVSKDGKFCPIELKYKTKSVKEEPELSRFGENLSKFKLDNSECRILKNQSAQDLGMYDFWKDVRRLELLKQCFPNVEGGLAVFLTNDGQYLKETKLSSNNCHLSMSEGSHDGNKHWLNEKSVCAKTHPGFSLDNKYSLKWKDINVQNIEFHFVTVMT